MGVILSFCISVFLSFLSFCTVQYNMYSTVTGEEDGVRGWLMAHSIFHSVCGVSVTGAASLVAECGTNILLQKNAENYFLKNPFWGTFKNWRMDLKVCADLS